MLDQIKTVFVNSVVEKTRNNASVALSPSTGKQDASTAFERSGWVYI